MNVYVKLYNIVHYYLDKNSILNDKMYTSDLKDVTPAYLKDAKVYEEMQDNNASLLRY